MGVVLQLSPTYLGAAILITVFNAALSSFLAWKGSDSSTIWAVGASLGMITGILLERAWA